MNRLILFLLFSVLAFANVGKITYVQNEVLIKRAGNEMPARVGMELLEKDEIVTRINAKTAMLMKDETAIALGQESALVIENYLFDEKSNNNATNYTSKGGLIGVTTGKIGKINPDKFQIKTYTATMGIRGTEFLGLVTQGGDSFYCKTGEIYVSASGSTVNVGSGFMTSVIRNQSPQQPRPYIPAEIEGLDSQVRPGITTQCPPSGQ